MKKMLRNLTSLDLLLSRSVAWDSLELMMYGDLENVPQGTIEVAV